MKSFKQPPSPQVVRRNGVVLDRASGKVLGKVYGAAPNFHYVTAAGEPDPLIYTGYSTRAQAVAALVHHQSTDSERA